jgi:hypothetical protein
MGGGLGWGKAREKNAKKDYIQYKKPIKNV